MSWPKVEASQESKWQQSVEKSIKKISGKKAPKTRRYMPKGIFYSPKGPMVYLASVARNSLSSGFRTNITDKALLCAALYIKEMRRRKDDPYFAIKTPVGILTLTEEDDHK